MQERWTKDSQDFHKYQTSAEIVLHSLRIYVSQSHILEILKSIESVSDLYCEHLWLYIKCSTLNNFLCNFV